MRHKLLTLLVVLMSGANLFAQTGEGGLRGYVRDEQAGSLPGATVTATSPALLAPVTATTDREGYYRLINLKPGTYTITAELQGFSKVQHTGVQIRAGNVFALDITLKVGRMEEAVTVESESPMLEVNKPNNVLNFDGEFQQHMPVASKKNWSDFLELTPGVLARPFDDGSGRMVYFGHGTEHFAHVIQLEGTIASNYYDAQVTYVGMGSDMIQDVQVKTGGADASTPMGAGLAMNVITKSGGNQFKGSVAYAYQPFEWNDNNASNCTAQRTRIGPSSVFTDGVVVSCDPSRPGGTPTTSYVRQFDASLGGPIKKDKIWFFGAIRKARSEAGISRTPTEVQTIQSFFPGAALFNNYTDSWQPYAKITARLNPSHELQAFYQRDRLQLSGDREYNYEPIQVQGTGGALYGAKLQSTWGRSVTTTLTASYNDKSGNDIATRDNAPGNGPQIVIHRTSSINADIRTGSGRILEGGNLQQLGLQPSSQIIVRGDLTWFKEGWAGTHEFQTGFFAAPRNRYDLQTQYFNDGFVLEERQMRDSNNPAAGLVPFHRRYQSPVNVKTREAHDRDIGVYLQDTWRPASRLTLNLGLRADFVRRYDGIFDIVRQNSTEIQPRFGFSYMVTADARNVLRGSAGRYPEQVMGRDAVTLFGAGDVAETRDLYDVDLDGTFETQRVTAARTATLAASEFDPDLHQPYVDEAILGFRKQFPWQISVDVAGIYRSYKDTYGEVDINGFWPSAPGQPFGGFGRVDPNRGIINQQTNNTWSTLEYRAIEITLAKNFSKGLQFVGGFNRQWQHYGGTWNPTSNARFIQPDAFPSNKLLFHPRGNQDDTPLPLTTGGNDRHYGPTWQKFSARFGATWKAPAGVLVGVSVLAWQGPFSGPVTDLLAANDPEVTKHGPTSFRLPNGTNQSNPLSTRLRYVTLACGSPPTAACYATRNEQVTAPVVKSVGLKVAKRVGLGNGREVEVAGNVYNLFNEGNYTQYSYSGAAEKFNRNNFLSPRNQQPARAFQLTGALRF
jgi:hypothetical protein